MIKEQIKQLIQSRIAGEGITETGIKGVQLFRVTEPVRCAPVVYEPSLVAILSGSKEAILDGNRHVYGSDEYLCCAMSMPLEAGTPNASPEDPLLGVYISLDSRVMTELAIEIENTSNRTRQPRLSSIPRGLALARWDHNFGNTLLRLLELMDSPADMAILGDGRLRELYYAVLKGDARDTARHAFSMGNEIGRAIDYLSSRLDKKITIDQMASHVGMSRAVFHRKFKQATSMSPIQFVKCMRLNNAAMKIAAGKNVNEAALEVGYLSSSQFSREFKRTYGQSPKQWIKFN